MVSAKAPGAGELFVTSIEKLSMVALEYCNPKLEKKLASSKKNPPGTADVDPIKIGGAATPSVVIPNTCAVLITINPNGSLGIQADPNIGPYDGSDDQLIGVINKSGATVFGIKLTGPDIFGFDGDGADASGGYEGPGTTFTISDANNGIVNFPAGLSNNASLWFSLEGAPSTSHLAARVAIDPGHGTKNCPLGRTGTTGPTNFPKTSPPPGHLLEYKLAWAIANAMVPILEGKGYEVTLTKSSETECPAYAKRATNADNAGANIFVSIHLDGSVNQAVNGSIGQYNINRSSSKALAQFVVNEVSSGLGTANKGIKNEAQNAVLHLPHMTSTLAEVATLTNVGGDETIMHGSTAVDDAASAIANGVDQFVNQ